MKLRSIEVRNWACIDELILTDLRDGVIVLHGPNRTGKSSLVQAIRSALFDHFHDSQESTLQSAIPFKSKATPQVTVEFEHAGQRYRIAKTFARTKEGATTLDQQGAAGWSTLVRGKDAAKRVREIVGVETSDAGVFQMLWLGQRDFQLPKSREVDATLQKALESVLGTLITGRDIDFKERLDKACERWFTVKTMQDRKSSPALKLAADLDSARAHQTEIERQWTDAEAALRQYDDALAEQPKLVRILEETTVDLERIQRECQGVRERKAQYELATKNLQHCDRSFHQAEKQLAEFDAAFQQLEMATKELGELQLKRRSAEDQCAQSRLAALNARQLLDLANQRLAQHRQDRSALDDRQRLITNRLEQAGVADKIRDVERLDKERADLEQKLVGPAPLSEKQIVELRQQRDEMARLRTRLEGGEIHVAIHAKTPLRVDLHKDGEPAVQAEIPAQKEQVWLVRQHAEFHLGDHATIRIGRGVEDRDIEAVASQLIEHEQAFRTALTAAHVNPDDPSALDQLAARRFHQEEFAKQLNSLRKQIALVAPNGMPALRAQLQQHRDEQAALLTRRPELCDWTPEQAELDRLRLDFEHAEAALTAKASDARDAQERCEAASTKATETEQSLREAIVGRTMQVDQLKERVARTDRATLVHAQEQATALVVEARRKLQESTLTEAEQAMETQFENIRAAHVTRAERVRQNENRIAELRGQLAGTEGLHQKRIQAEQAVNDRARELERESSYAAAHKHLKEMFETVRQEQVRRTVGPINDRVMQWAGLLGLTDYASLSFGSQLLPQGLVPSHAADGDAMEIERESYGTLEQLSLLIRLAVGGLLAKTEATVAILDDPLAHADAAKHRKMLDILSRASQGEPYGPHPTGALQVIVLTCHAERFDYLSDAQHFDLGRLIRRGG